MSGTVGQDWEESILFSRVAASLGKDALDTAAKRAKILVQEEGRPAFFYVGLQTMNRKEVGKFAIA